MIRISRRDAVVCSLLVWQAGGALYLAAWLQLVPARHILFVVGSCLYCVFANFYICRTGNQNQVVCDRKSVSPRVNAVRLLFPFTVVFSLLTPTFLMVVASAAQQQASSSRLNAIVAPALFLTLSQLFCESAAFLASSFFTRYVRLGLSIAFVTYRIPVMALWYRLAVSWSRSDEAARLPFYVAPLAQAAAVLNIIYWAFCLLFFLLLYCLPEYLVEPKAVNAQANNEQGEVANADTRKTS